MNIDRLGLGFFAVLSALLLAWNLKLQFSEPAAGPRIVQESPEASSMTGVQERDASSRTAERTRAVEGYREAGRDLPPASDADAFVPDEEQKEEDAERPRRRRMDWDAIRSEMESDTVEIVESFAATQKWEPAVADDVITILLDSSDEIAQLWTDARGENGDDRSRYQIHREMEDIRNAAADSISEMIGRESYDALAEELFEARHETFRRRQDR